jgi:hypothetical protein
VSKDAYDWLEAVEFRGSPAVLRRARSVLLVLAHFAHPETQIAHPGRKKINRLTGMSFRTIDRALEDLTRSGCIVRAGNPGYRKATEYFVDLAVAVVDLERAPSMSDARGPGERAPYPGERAPYPGEGAPPGVAARRTDNEIGTTVGDQEAAVGPPRLEGETPGAWLKRAYRERQSTDGSS